MKAKGRECARCGNSESGTWGGFRFGMQVEKSGRWGGEGLCHSCHQRIARYRYLAKQAAIEADRKAVADFLVAVRRMVKAYRESGQEVAPIDADYCTALKGRADAYEAKRKVLASEYLARLMVVGRELEEEAV